MKTSRALVTTIILLAAITVEASWGRRRGFDGFGHYPTIQPDWGADRRHVRYPQQHHGSLRQRSPHWRDLSPHQTSNVRPPLPPAPPSESNANDDFTAAFLEYAGDDVFLSPQELGELVGLAMGESAPLTRHSVLQILQQWDHNYDGGLNLSEFMRMYGELQRQMPSTFQQHWDNIRHLQGKTGLADQVSNNKDIQSHNRNIPLRQKPSAAAQAIEEPTLPSRPERELSTLSPSVNSHTTTVKRAAGSSGKGMPQPRKGRLNYIEKGERFFELVFDDEDHENGDGPLTVQTIVSTRVVGDTDSWAESEVW